MELFWMDRCTDTMDKVNRIHSPYFIRRNSVIPTIRWSHVQPVQVTSFCQQHNPTAENIHPGLFPSGSTAFNSQLFQKWLWKCFRWTNVLIFNKLIDITPHRLLFFSPLPVSERAPTPQPLTTLHSSNIRDIDLSICNALQNVTQSSGVTLETHAMTFVGDSRTGERGYLRISGLAEQGLSSSTHPMQ